MNVLDAALHTVHDRAHGGSQGIAPRMGKSHQALSAEVAGKPGSKFGLMDALTLQLLTGNHRILHAMAAELGEMCVPLPDMAFEPNSLCMVKVSTVAQDFGRLMSELAEDLADSRITDPELARIEAKWGELIGAGQAMLRHLVAMNANLPGKASAGDQA